VSRVFVDTSAWYAFVDRADPSHDPVVATFKARRGRLVTSDYVFDEIVTLLRYRAGWAAAHRLGETLWSDRIAQLARISPGDCEAAWRLFARRDDQRLSFTDCTSVALMQRLKLTVAITLDSDFRALGLVTLP
jgi:predicted nucleic acid-binding protein